MKTFIVRSGVAPVVFTLNGPNKSIDFKWDDLNKLSLGDTREDILPRVEYGTLLGVIIKVIYKDDDAIYLYVTYSYERNLKSAETGTIENIEEVAEIVEIKRPIEDEIFSLPVIVNNIEENIINIPFVMRNDNIDPIMPTPKVDLKSSWDFEVHFSDDYSNTIIAKNIINGVNVPENNRLIYIIF